MTRIVETVSRLSGRISYNPGIYEFSLLTLFAWNPLSRVGSTAAATVFAGAICGQLTMGYAGDLFGRTEALFLTLSIAAISAVASAVAPQGSATVVYAVIIVCRFLLGIGLGGVYPLSATKAAEDSSSSNGKVNSKGSAMSFFWQAPGAMTPWIVAYFCSFSDLSANSQWRLLLGLGSIPAVFVVMGTYIESTQESKSTNSVRKPFNTGGISLMIELQKTENIKKLLVTGGGWFIYDIAFYGVNLFAGAILDEMNGDDDNVSSASSIRDITSKQMIGNGMAIPAVLLTICLMGSVSTKRLQVIGFILIAVGFVLLACLFVPLKNENPDLLFAFYCLLLFSLSFGPNVTTYVLSAETYPKEIRSTFTGISAACGKMGAVVGAYVFGNVSKVTTYPVIMVVCAVISIFGAIISHVYISDTSDIDEATTEDFSYNAMYDDDIKE